MHECFRPGDLIKAEVSSATHIRTFCRFVLVFQFINANNDVVRSSSGNFSGHISIVLHIHSQERTWRVLRGEFRRATDGAHQLAGDAVPRNKRETVSKSRESGVEGKVKHAKCKPKKKQSASKEASSSYVLTCESIYCNFFNVQECKIVHVNTRLVVDAVCAPEFRKVFKAKKNYYSYYFTPSSPTIVRWIRENSNLIHSQRKNATFKLICVLRNRIVSW